MQPPFVNTETKVADEKEEEKKGGKGGRRNKVKFSVVDETESRKGILTVGRE
jgi:hypothetical protein